MFVSSVTHVSPRCRSLHLSQAGWGWTDTHSLLEQLENDETRISVVNILVGHVSERQHVFEAHFVLTLLGPFHPRLRMTVLVCCVRTPFALALCLVCDRA